MDRDWSTSVRQDYGLSGAATPVLRSWDTFDRERWRQGGYLRGAVRPTPGITVDGGARLERESVYGEITTSPWLLARWTPHERISLSAGAGAAHQLPEVNQLSPEGTVDPAAAERARYLDVSAEYRLTPFIRVAASVYDRDETGTLRQDIPTPRLLNGAVYFPLSSGTVVERHGRLVARRRVHDSHRTAPTGTGGLGVGPAYGHTKKHRSGHRRAGPRRLRSAASC